MVEEKNKQKEKDEECPMCQVSEETLERLKKAGRNKKTEQKSAQNDE